MNWVIEKADSANFQGVGDHHIGIYVKKVIEESVAAKVSLLFSIRSADESI